MEGKESEGPDSSWVLLHAAAVAGVGVGGVQGFQAFRAERGVLRSAGGHCSVALCFVLPESGVTHVPYLNSTPPAPPFHNHPCPPSAPCPLPHPHTCGPACSPLHPTNSPPPTHPHSQPRKWAAPSPACSKSARRRGRCATCSAGHATPWRARRRLTRWVGVVVAAGRCLTCVGRRTCSARRAAQWHARRRPAR